MDERIIEYFVSDDVGEMRADKLFASVIEDVSRARLQKAFDLGQVSFEGEVIDKRFKIRHSGWLRATLDEVSMDEVPKVSRFHWMSYMKMIQLLLLINLLEW